MIVHVRLFTLLLVVIAFTGCDAHNSKLIGRWQNIDKASDRMEFMRDGIAIYEYQGLSAEGAWELLDDGRLRMKAQVFGMMSVETSTVEWRGPNEIALTNSNDEVDVYQRL